MGLPVTLSQYWFGPTTASLEHLVHWLAGARQPSAQAVHVGFPETRVHAVLQNGARSSTSCYRWHAHQVLQ